MEAREDGGKASSMGARNRITGGAVVLLGIYVIAESLRYRTGTMARMGPGFLPLALGVLSIVFGLLIALVNDDGDKTAPRIAWRPAALVLSAILAFAVLIEPLGLVAATAALVFVSGAADPTHNWKSLTGLFVFLLVAVYLIFDLALGIPFDLVSGVI